MNDQSIYQDAPSYFHYYFDLVQTNDLNYELQKNKQATIDFIQSIPLGKEDYAYQKGKWTIKEVIRHIVDTERVFAYRAFRFSRFDSTELAGFDENHYINNVKDINFDINDLLSEFVNLRSSTVNLFETMTDQMLDFKGTANNNKVSARALGFMIIGHNLHHCNFVSTHYLDND